MAIQAPKQPAVGPEQLRRAQAQSDAELDRKIVDRIPHGAMLIFTDMTDVPDGWHLCDGRTLLRAQYPKLAAALAGAGDQDSFELPLFAAPVGFSIYVWGPD
jgi:hypothetical protein